MGLSVIQGSFVADGSVSPATQAVAHGLGATPGLLVLFATTGTTGSTADFAITLGFASGTSNQCLIHGYGQNGQSTQRSQGSLRTDNIYERRSGNTTLAALGALTAIDATNFTITWSTANTDTIFYVAIGGTDFSAEVINFALETVGLPDTQAVTTSFQPKAVILLGSDRTTSGSGQICQPCIGIMDGTNQFVVQNYIQDAIIGATDAMGGILTDKVLSILDDTNTITEEAAFSAFGATSFTIDRTVNGSAKLIAAIVLGGSAQYAVGTFTQPTAGSPPVSQEVNFSTAFQPSINFFLHAMKASGASSDHARIGFGVASSSSAELSAAATYEDAQATSDAQSVTASDRMIAAYTDGTATVLADADFTTNDADGFTIAWQTLDAVGRTIGYLGIGAAAAAGGGANTRYYLGGNHFNRSQRGLGWAA